MTYTTKLLTRDIDIDGLEEKYPELRKVKYDVSDASAVIEWEVELEHRSWGIKGIYVNVTKLNGTITVEILDDNGDAKEEKEIEFDLSDFRNECDFSGEIDGDGIGINDLTIDFARQVAYVE